MTKTLDELEAVRSPGAPCDTPLASSSGIAVDKPNSGSLKRRRLEDDREPRNVT